jgi:hypothetical protein
VPEGTANIIFNGLQFKQSAQLKQNVHKRATPLKISTGVHVAHGAVYPPGHSHRGLGRRREINRI